MKTILIRGIIWGRLGKTAAYEAAAARKAAAEQRKAVA